LAHVTLSGAPIRPTHADEFIRATFELDPIDLALTLALQLSTAMAGGPQWAEGHVVSVTADRACIGLPAVLVGGNLAALMAGVLAGEAMEIAAIKRCRLVGLQLPDDLLPGPAIGASAGVDVGVIVKPSLGLTPDEVAEVVEAAVAGGARWIKDDEVLADPPWCRLSDRVGRVAPRLAPGVVYFANVTGPSTDLVDRARRVVDLGATGVMVAAVAQGLDGVLALRRADLGVPILAHRAGSGPWCRNDRFGITGAVLIDLMRAAGADAVIVGAFGGKLFESDGEVDSNLAAARRPTDILSCTALLGGGLGAGDLAGQFLRAGGTGLVGLLGSAAYGRGRAGLARTVAAAVASLS